MLLPSGPTLDSPPGGRVVLTAFALCLLTGSSALFADARPLLRKYHYRDNKSHS